MNTAIHKANGNAKVPVLYMATERSNATDHSSSYTLS